MKKIVFGITGLTLGGAERVLVDLANKLSRTKDCEITIFTIYAKGELEKQLDEKVKLKTIYDIQYKELTNVQKKVIIPMKILLEKRKIYKKYIKDRYDIEVAFLEGAITRIFSVGKEKEKKIAWVHNDISKVFGTGIKAKIKKKIDEKTYRKFGKLIFVSKDNLEKFQEQYKNDSEKEVIYNYIDAGRIIEKSNESISEKIDDDQINLVTVARLVPQKGLDRFIKVHAKLIQEGIKHKLYIIGEGPEKEKLEEIIEKEKCSNTVKLLGSKENPYPYMKKATYFCLFSNYEGYPMTLLEAKILEKNIVITDTSAKEVIQDYETSEVFENSEQGIYIGLKRILKDEATKMNQKHCEYSNENIIKQISELLELK